MHTRTTAGQASIEYIAAIALVVAIFVVAGPAVGAPNLGSVVASKMRLAICVVANDVCSDKLAKEAGLAPCPISGDTKGREVSGTIVVLEIGHKWLLTITRNSDGSVSVVRTASGSAGAAVGLGAGLNAGPLRFEVGESASVRGRLQVASGWNFKDQATADRFLKHALLNSWNNKDFPEAWFSAEGGLEGSETAGLSVSAKGSKDRGELVGLAATGSAALGVRKATRGGPYTLYGRVSMEEFELSLPLLASKGSGREDWVVEYTFDRDGTPRELAFRHADPSEGGNRVTETVERLDLRDPANRAVAQPLLDVKLPWPKGLAARVDAVLRQIDAHGTVETTVSDIDDDSAGVSGSFAGGVKGSISYRKVKVHRSLVSATARTGGPFDRERFDCELAQG